MSGGRLDIETYPAEGIVGTFDMFDAVQTGTLDGFISWPQYWPGKHALAVYLSSYPYGLDEAWMWEVWFYNMGGIDLAREDYARFGMYYVAPIQTGPNYAHSTKPLSKMEDWKGLKCRYPGGMIAEIYEKAGASVIILPGSEIYTAMATGVIDLGEYVGHAMNRELGLHEVGKYIIGPGQMHQPVDLQAFVMNQNSWNKLPEDLQRLLEVGSRDLSWSLHTNIMGSDLVALKWMVEEYGNVYMELPAEERAKFRKISVELWNKWAKDDISQRAVRSQIMLMNAIGLLDFPGIKDEVEKYFPGLLAEPLSGKIVEDFWTRTPVE
jgi:TRAP-type mannitol/chloroaromatic compound transport system substrate-binding protein